MTIQIVENKLYLELTEDYNDYAFFYENKKIELIRQTKGIYSCLLPDLSTNETLYLTTNEKLNIFFSSMDSYVVAEGNTFYTLTAEENQVKLTKSYESQKIAALSELSFYEGNCTFNDSQATITLSTIKDQSSLRLWMQLTNEKFLLDFALSKNNELLVDKKYFQTALGTLVLSIDGKHYQLKKEAAITSVFSDLQLTLEKTREKNGHLLFDLAEKNEIEAVWFIINRKIVVGEVSETGFSLPTQNLTGMYGQLRLYLLLNDSLVKITHYQINDFQSNLLSYEDDKLYLLPTVDDSLQLSSDDFKNSQKIKGDITEINDSSLFLTIDSGEPLHALIIKNRASEKYYLHKIAKQELGLSIDISSFLQTESALLKESRFDLYALGFKKGQQKLFRLMNKQELPKNKKDRFFPILKQTNTNQSVYTQNYQFYIANNNYFALFKGSRSNLIKDRYSLKTEITDFDYKSKKAHINFSVKTPNTADIEFASLVLVRRNKDGFDQVKIPLQSIIKKEKTIDAIAIIDFSDYSFEPLYWDPYAAIYVDGEKQLIRLNKSKKKAVKNIRSNTLNYQYHTADGYLMYPYVTITGDISFTYRIQESYETSINNFKEKYAYYLARLLKPYFAKKDIWIAFEKLAESAHDSGYHFFDYCYQNKKHENFYYVIRKGAAEEKFLADKKDKVLYFMTFKYFLYLFSARLLISSDTKRNVYNLKQKETYMGRVLSAKPLAYLQHGVNGLKKVPDFYKNRDVFDLVSVPSEFEKNFVLKEWGYSEKEVAVTGLARWDVMEDRTAQIDFKQIFVMPTWRTWMDGLTKEKFMETDYFKQYSQFLASKKLKEILLAGNARIAFFLHPKFKEYIELFDIDPEIITKYEFLEVPLDDMIMKSSMMISDYSSVIWEMFYLKKPCVFYQFDIDKYMQYEGMYLDPKTDLFGDAAYDTAQLLELIQENIENNFQEKQQYAEMRSTYFSLMDHNNSERIFNAIEKSNVTTAKNGGIKQLNLKSIMQKVKIGRK